ncbi:hypothetical protein EJ04DRAFT_139116 [Polyplosphaeria fusca]|uniref:Uncharacterized protein n=1 Tax=Polyplosphaeria fusca TaxID=682080 RepID=A0A9P4V506_9PLEO|nr:hypothetical protein EJ04DRAFT_139116 [Polyplosphaeria fusca]
MERSPPVIGGFPPSLLSTSLKYSNSPGGRPRLTLSANMRPKLVHPDQRLTPDYNSLSTRPGAMGRGPVLKLPSWQTGDQKSAEGLGIAPSRLEDPCQNTRRGCSRAIP